MPPNREPDPDLEPLLARCRAGDELAWEELVRRMQKRVYGLALGIVHDPEEARDAAQEVFVKIYHHLGELRQGQAFVPWMLRLTRNASIDRLRRNVVRTPEIAVPAEESHHLRDPRPSPEDDARLADRRRLLHRALGRLGASSREIVVLKEIQGMKLEEIAELLAVPLGTVKSRSHRARIELAEAVLELEPSYGA